MKPPGGAVSGEAIDVHHLWTTPKRRTDAGGNPHNV